MKKYFLFAALFFSTSLYAQVNRVDHFFVSSPKAEQLFKLFRDELGLPVAWDYKDWGGFSSGAVALGNVSFEFVSFDSVKETKFDAIALEAHEPVEEFILVLDARKITHDTIEYSTYTKKDGSTGGWATLNLPKLLPEGAGLFICDYKERNSVVIANTRDSAELKKRKGGPLGVTALKEFVIASPDPASNKKELSKIPGIINNQTDLYSFSRGPSIRLIRSAHSRFEKIVIHVNSLTAAKEYLQSHKLLGSSSANSIYINPQAIEGLTVELVNK
ncbi:MAG: hypothetical protein ABI666_08805 [Ferruginibacter sp.]